VEEEFLQLFLTTVTEKYAIRLQYRATAVSKHLAHRLS